MVSSASSIGPSSFEFCSATAQCPRVSGFFALWLQRRPSSVMHVGRQRAASIFSWASSLAGRLWRAARSRSTSPCTQPAKQGAIQPGSEFTRLHGALQEFFPPALFASDPRAPLSPTKPISSSAFIRLGSDWYPGPVPMHSAGRSRDCQDCHLATRSIAAH